MKKLIILLVFVSFPVFAQFRIADDHWDSKQGTVLKHDKLEHFAVSSGLTIGLQILDKKNGWKYALLSGFLWEIKDGLMPYEKYGEFGGEGFSSKDLIADAVGVFIGYWIYKFGKWFFKLIF